ncbi:hypothetical protein [Dyella sp. GSA-30]|uniref:hypothetical protein n=1 Tax=Dyella sp. GSA-30 TaxID=2994496 RepID=UPI0024902E70|nr:hypothetical protein [Dyella sp. GSA-30]BDU22895.1 hypothetical protein DYGSA30_43520 [Dyella sp. GSA-30]
MSSDTPPPRRTFTQQGADRSDRYWLRVADRSDISDGDIINKLAELHSRPRSAEAFAQAVGAVLITRAHMRREAPIADAVQAIMEERKALDRDGVTDRDQDK